MLTPQALLTEAQSRTGLGDFGEDSFREPLEVLLRSVNQHSDFSEFGTMAFRETVINSLVNRLQIEDWYRRHPEMDNEDITAPTFIVGLPRTGSTLLSSLFALDPATRTLRTWESPSPCPPPVKGDTADPRIAQGAARIRLFEERWPLIFKMIPLGVHEPFECNELLFNAFCCDYFYQYSSCPEYLEWLYTPGRDLSFGYRYHKRALKILQWRHPPKRWVLKMPGHCFMIESLNRVYPDARFIMTHRDPVQALPSVSHLVAQMREDYLHNAEMDTFFGEQVDIWEKSLGRLLQFRSRNDARFVDIHHRDLLRDSPAELERIYRWLGWAHTDALSKAIHAWREAHPRDVRPADSAQQDFDPDEIKRRFAFYRDQFIAA